MNIVIGVPKRSPVADPDFHQCSVFRSNKFLLKHLVIKTSDKKLERFDRSTVIFKFKFMNKNSAYIQFLKEWDER